MTDGVEADVEQFRRSNNFDLREETSAIWIATLGPLELPLPNFRWRREILAQHDRHHLITGYDTSPRGELLVAAWEVGARSYQDWRAMALCRFLCLLGFIRYPLQTWDAYRAGKTVNV